MIQDPLLVFAYLAAVVAVVFQVARLPALRRLFDRLPALVWTYFVPMLSTTVGLLPAESPVYRAIARYLLPASLALLLLSSELKAIARLGRTALVVMTVGMIGIMLGGVAGFFLLHPWLPPESWKAVGDRLGSLRDKQVRAPTVGDMTLVGFAVVLTAACLKIGSMLPAVGQVLNGFSWAILLLTTAALLFSLTPLARLEQTGASTVGYAGFYLLLASIGAQGDLRKVASHPQFILLGVIVIVVHATLLFAAVRVIRAPLFFLGAASQACVGGYSSAPLVAAIYQPAMAPVGLLLAVLGNVVGTYLGLAVAQALSGWA